MSRRKVLLLLTTLPNVICSAVQCMHQPRQISARRFVLDCIKRQFSALPYTIQIYIQIHIDRGAKIAYFKTVSAENATDGHVQTAHVSLLSPRRITTQLDIANQMAVFQSAPVKYLQQIALELYFKMLRSACSTVQCFKVQNAPKSYRVFQSAYKCSCVFISAILLLWRA